MTWAYHATSTHRLLEIVAYGLEPIDPILVGLEQPFGVYFSPLPRLALQWNNVLLRFPWPDEYEEDPYLGATLIDGEVVPTGFYTEQSIPSENIDVKVGRRWIPIYLLLAGMTVRQIRERRDA